MGIRAIILLSLLTPAYSWASGGYGDLLSDTWVATDALGRKLPGRAACGVPRTGKFVGIFYFLWLGQHGTGGPYDVTKLLAANPTDPAWGPLYKFHHWGESELGYYLSQDPYVIRRHCHMLVDAGVDTLIFDVTNGYTYASNYLAVCSVMSQIRSEGGRTPQICFLANTSSAAVVQQLYDEFYSKNLYPELWFRWKGKPLMMSPTAGLSEPVLSFFTFRQSWAWSSSAWFGDGQHKWTWLDNYPQNFGWDTPNVPEQISVCTAQHPVTNIGRSFHDGREPAAADQRPGEGLCFAEQSRRALEVDPEFLFITGWNEWVAQRFVSDGNMTFLGSKLPAGQTYFVDAYTQEYSRDIEPMKGGHSDNYYFQMVDLIRRFKGVRQVEAPSPATTIAIDGALTDWTNIQPDYWDTPYDTVARNHAGWGDAGTYVNNTGRNDITRCKVTYDAENVYFYVETRANLSSSTGTNWMLLFIDADHNPDTGWAGYDYLVNSPVVSTTSTTLKRNAGGYNWTQVAQVDYRVSQNRLELRLPRSVIGMASTSDLWFDFHWADNIQKADISEFGINGDSAPNRRFNYRFNTVTTAPGAASQLSLAPLPGKITLNWVNPSTITFAATTIRCSTSGFPTGPTDGELVAEVTGTPGGLGTFVHKNLTTGSTYYYAAFSRDDEGRYSAGATASVRLVPCDFDGDLDVDQSDYGLFQNCLSGGEIVAPGSDCDNMDLDRDSHVDRDDFSSFQQCFAGPGASAC